VKPVSPPAAPWQIRRLLGFLLLVAWPAAAAPPATGWQRFDLPATGSYMWRYLPPGLDLSKPVPLILFLHGSGSTPDAYLDYVFPEAQAAGCIVALPKQ
jgi:poly(3-hydroxybutyrate) depolymerase